MFTFLCKWPRTTFGAYGTLRIVAYNNNNFFEVCFIIIIIIIIIIANSLFYSVHCYCMRVQYFSIKIIIIIWILSVYPPFYVLFRYIPVDIYGGCGIPCRAVSCYDILKKDYKFYLSFENSNCNHYITEKVYRNAFRYSLILTNCTFMYDTKTHPMSNDCYSANLTEVRFSSIL